IKKLKDKVTDHQKRALKDQFDDFSRASVIHVNSNDRANKTIKTKRVVPETMTVDEALDKIDDVKGDFLIFKNVETDRLNVLVRKDEEHFKLFEP
ncbi:MAG: sigma 54 modulation/S30EA ribosomal C-terminal domain-containing protein, partial [Candidatus Cloacimonadaceae bacterium]|nr:sigma 54 modulation/S30EA ribosomal C-terminal domain-containing protein [Candidatus Cloacimonadaceae bacterium]